MAGWKEGAHNKEKKRKGDSVGDGDLAVEMGSLGDQSSHAASSDDGEGVTIALSDDVLEPVWESSLGLEPTGGKGEGGSL